jgi:glyoxylase-like metal-dependent hydrolase (beta-lactamase superfamily II)
MADPPDGAAADDSGERELLRARDVERVRAANPSAMTLSGTNTYLVGREPTYVIDPGPAIEAHIERVSAAIAERGGLGAVILTHDHGDHAGAVHALRARHPAPLAAGRGEAEMLLADGERVGPLEALATPGHAPDHFALIGAGACFSGDAVLGEGSVFISAYAGALGGYLQALARLRERADFDLICPGHGPLVRDGHAKLEEYIEHRMERERRLLAALAEGRRTVQELLDSAWSEVPRELHRPAAMTLAAHLDKLDREGALPLGVERAATLTADEPQRSTRTTAS